MRVPLEILRLVLEQAERDFSLKHFFALRLVNRLFDDEVLSTLFRARKIHQRFRNVSNSFYHFPPRLKRKYLYFRVEAHHQGRPSVFSTLFYRTLNLHLKKRGIDGIAFHEAEVKEVVCELIDTVDLSIFNKKVFDNQWVFFLQGPGMRHWLSLYDAKITHDYPDFNLALRLYFFLRLLHSKMAFGLAPRIRALLECLVVPEYRLAFAHDVLMLTVAFSNGWIIDSVFALQLADSFKYLPLRPFIEEAARKKRGNHRDWYDHTTSRLIRLLGKMDDITGPTANNRLLLTLSDAIGDALEAGEPEISAIIIYGASRCESSAHLEVLFRVVFGEDYDYRKTDYRLTENRLEAIREELDAVVASIAVDHSRITGQAQSNDAHPRFQTPLSSQVSSAPQ